MNNFEKKMYEFLTAEENFESAFEISQQLPEAIERLKKEFWSSVSEKLKEKCKGGWVFYPEEDDEIGLYQQEWKGTKGDFIFWIGYEDISNKLWYGLFIDENNKKRKFDMGKINGFAENNHKFNDLEWKDKFWKKDTSYNFNEIHTLKRMLPNNREEFANQLVEILFEFAENMKDDVNKICKMIKK